MDFIGNCEQPSFTCGTNWIVLPIEITERRLDSSRSHQIRAPNFNLKALPTFEGSIFRAALRSWLSKQGPYSTFPPFLRKYVFDKIIIDNKVFITNSFDSSSFHHCSIKSCSSSINTIYSNTIKIITLKQQNHHIKKKGKERSIPH